MRDKWTLVTSAIFVAALSYGGVRQDITPTEEYWGDCMWSGKAFTWIDANRDGKFDAGEQPLSDVHINVGTYPESSNKSVTGGNTDQTGEAVFDSFPICPGDHEWDVYPNIPQGFRLTTPEKLKANPDMRITETYYFGFESTYLPARTPNP